MKDKMMASDGGEDGNRISFLFLLSQYDYEDNTQC